MTLPATAGAGAASRCFLASDDLSPRDNAPAGAMAAEPRGVDDAVCALLSLPALGACASRNRFAGVALNFSCRSALCAGESMSSPKSESSTACGTEIEAADDDAGSSQDTIQKNHSLGKSVIIRVMNATSAAGR